MIASLLGGGAALLRKAVPAAINWGMNKLMNSNFGRSYITPDVLQTLGTGVNMMQQYHKPTSGQPDQIMEANQSVVKQLNTSRPKQAKKVRFQPQEDDEDYQDIEQQPARLKTKKIAKIARRRR